MSVEDFLSGCPYSLPDGSDVAAELARVRDVEVRVSAKMQSAARKLMDAGAFADFYRGQRAREVYESNSIEGLGPSLPQTATILESNHADRISSAVGILHDHAFVDGLRRDAHLVEVLGLHGAKVLGESLLENMKSGRPMTEADIRQMHEMISLGEIFAGRYKHWHVTISGDGVHEPHFPSDTPQAMYELVSWMARDTPMPGTIKASIVHAWLTHIHPFEDGNGRLARLIANLILAKVGLPPAIIAHNTQRASYIDALGHSDTGGDILPLTGVFLNAIKRFGREIEKPNFLRRILRDDIGREKSTVFRSWQSSFNDFSSRLFGELQLRRFRVHDMGALDAQSFGLLSEQDASGATWLFIASKASLDLLVWVGYSSVNISGHVDSLVRYPSLFFSVRAGSYRTRPYRQAHPSEVGGMQEVCVTPGNGRNVYAVVDDRVRFGGIVDSAAEIAERIDNGLTLRLSRLVG